MIIPSYIGVISKNKLFDGGNGSIENPYRIVKSYHFDNMRRFPTASYSQENDLVFTDEFEPDGEYYNNGNLWLPVPGNFTGRYNGNGYKIENLKSVPQGNQRGAFFTTLGGVIENLYLKNIWVSNTSLRFIASIAGNSSALSLIQNVFVDGQILAGWNSAGILGRSSGGTIRRCGVNITLRGSNVQGGIFAGSSSTIHIHDSYSRGTMTNLLYHRGGIMGSTFGARLYRCYSTINMRGSNNHLSRGLISTYDGYNATQENSYWDREATGTASSFAGGIAMFTTQAKYPYGLINDELPYQNWDFDNVWAHDVDGTINDGYPYLRNVTPIN